MSDLRAGTTPPGSLLDALREADETLVNVGALDQARAVRNAATVLQAIDGARIDFGRDHSGGDTAPHEFEPLKRWRNRGRCRACKVHEANHPTGGWMPARPWRDESEAYRLD